MWRWLFPFLILFLIPFLSSPIKAVTVEVSDAPKEINTEFLVNVKVSGAKSAKNYFKLTLKKDNKDTSFIETWNGRNWYSGSDVKEYFMYEVSKVSTFQLKGKLSEEFISEGTYTLSIKRYTESGALASNDSTNDVSVFIKQAKVEIETPSPTPVITSPPVPTPTAYVQPIATATEKILAVESTFSELPEPTPNKIQAKVVSSNDSINKPLDSRYITLPIVIILVGLVLITIGIFMFWREGGYIDIMKT